MRGLDVCTRLLRLQSHIKGILLACSLLKKQLESAVLNGKITNSKFVPAGELRPAKPVVRASTEIFGRKAWACAKIAKKPIANGAMIGGHGKVVV